MEPVQRQNVFAGIDGKVEELKVAHGEHVTKGELLIKLGSNSDFDVQLEQVEGEYQANIKKLHAIDQGLTDPKLNTEQRIRLSGDKAETEQKVLTLSIQRAVLLKKKAELEIRSPIDGIVVTFDPWNRLINRPVQHGNALLKVANTEGPWQLELHMPENRMGHVLEAQQKKYEFAREKLRELLREELHAKQHDASDEQVGEAVEKALAEISNERLHTKLQEIYLARFRAGSSRSSPKRPTRSSGRSSTPSCTPPTTTRPRSG